MFKKFRQLSKGIRRILIAGTLVMPFLISIVFCLLDTGEIRTDDLIGYAIVAGTPIYWVFVLVGAWVADGFKKENYVESDNNQKATY